MTVRDAATSNDCFISLKPGDIKQQGENNYSQSYFYPLYT